MLRLFVVILSLLLTLPVAAAPSCHDSAMPGMTMAAPVHDHTRHAPAAPSTAGVAHECIGCIPPAGLDGVSLGAPPMLRDQRRVAATVDGHANPLRAPTPPPPMNG
jgi:hypothetical protein